MRGRPVPAARLLERPSRGPVELPDDDPVVLVQPRPERVTTVLAVVAAIAGLLLGGLLLP